MKPYSRNTTLKGVGDVMGKRMNEGCHGYVQGKGSVVGKNKGVGVCVVFQVQFSRPTMPHHFSAFIAIFGTRWTLGHL